jgi:hypothetical protein
MTVNKLHNELHYLYISPNNIRVTKSRRMGWAGMWHVWEEESCMCGFGEKWKNNIHVRLKYVQRGSVLDYSGSGYGQVEGSYAHGNKFPGSTKCG